ncbi:DUF4249 domain-containing protein [Flavobacterium sp. J27]|uniref:DUF4249 domain-containing protein n=1 Tax=Flavobacterium sp. J27 TaxID=2060419 RepID=UPI001031EA26|nr:DUF4249 domain-containing protein [Flavobacterium sp. J27]
MKKRTLIIIFIISIVTLIKCTEPYDFKSEISDFENLLIVESTITNQNKIQKVKLTRTVPLESSTDYEIENNAQVYITDSNGNNYTFSEGADGYYNSNLPFAAQPNVTYELHIKTESGDEYKSELTQITPQTQITTLAATRINYFGVDGVAITVSNNATSNTPKYYRYEYEETSKIIAPYWSNDSLTVTGNDQATYEFQVVERTSESKECYKTNLSNEIIIHSTVEQTDGILSNAIVRFISKEDYIIANGYSILVKQYDLSPEAYNFYKSIANFNNNSNLLFPLQPGFIYGNIQCVSDESKKVIGYFDICSYSEQRLYFDFATIFPNESIPDFPYSCSVEQYNAQLLCNPQTTNCESVKGKTSLAEQVLNNELALYQYEVIPPLLETYDMVNLGCGDCRLLGSNIKPDFWP